MQHPQTHLKVYLKFFFFHYGQFGAHLLKKKQNCKNTTGSLNII